MNIIRVVVYFFFKIFLFTFSVLMGLVNNARDKKKKNTNTCHGMLSKLIL